MADVGGFALPRSHSEDRFYSPPAMRRHQQMLLQKQQMFKRQQEHLLSTMKLVEAGKRTESDDSVTTLSQPPTIDPSPPGLPSTNLDRLLESVTPFVTVQYFPQVKVRERRRREAELHPFYYLEDLWNSFNEWSVYGVGVPLALNGKDLDYVPYLSGIQLYVDPLKPHSRLRTPGEESEVESSGVTFSSGSSNLERDKQSKSSVDGLSNQHNLVNLNTQPLNSLSLQGTPVTSSSSDEAESFNSPGQLLFEYLEEEQPHNRKPLSDKISVLASQFPDIRKLRSCDILSASWISVAWYPIYRVPIGSTLRDFDASFLTFHCLSTRSKCSAQHPFHGAAGQKVHKLSDGSSKMSLPIFGLASYKWKGSILSPCGPHECEQENSLLQAADSWLRRLHIGLPDYQFFHAHYSHWR